MPSPPAGLGPAELRPFSGRSPRRVHGCGDLRTPPVGRAPPRSSGRPPERPGRSPSPAPTRCTGDAARRVAEPTARPGARPPRTSSAAPPTTLRAGRSIPPDRGTRSVAPERGAPSLLEARRLPRASSRPVAAVGPPGHARPVRPLPDDRGPAAGAADRPRNGPSASAHQMRTSRPDAVGRRKPRSPWRGSRRAADSAGRRSPNPRWTTGAGTHRMTDLEACDHLTGFADRGAKTPRTPGIFRGFSSINSGSDLLSQGVYPQVPSAHASLTSVFGMGTGVTSPLWPPEISCQRGSPTRTPEQARTFL